MKQTLQFVPLRLATALGLVLAAALYSPASAAVEIVLVSAENENIDPIVTGSGSSSDEIRQWKERQKRFDDCGLCGEMQPYPGDLPE